MENAFLCLRVATVIFIKSSRENLNRTIAGLISRALCYRLVSTFHNSIIPSRYLTALPLIDTLSFFN